MGGEAVELVNHNYHGGGMKLRPKAELSAFLKSAGPGEALQVEKPE